MPTPAAPVLVLSYAGCSTCKKALAWVKARGISVEVRPLVEAPPTREELAAWIPRSGRPVRRWLNTSGQSYRALGKDVVAALSDDDVVARLAADGKLVKRPVLVAGERVLVGFDEAAWADALGAR